jgi:hypothetical protein
MANMKYFADINGQTVELSHVEHDGHVSSKATHFRGYLPGVDLNTARRSDKVQATRAIEYKSNPSKHKCDARCTNARGFRCECECGGKNHGAGNFTCEVAA